MKVMDVLQRIKSGERVMVTMPSPPATRRKFSLTDGTEVGQDQFEKLAPFLRPEDAGLFGDDPQSYSWAG